MVFLPVNDVRGWRVKKCGGVGAGVRFEVFNVNDTVVAKVRR